ncbi:MAG: phospholipase D family protein [Coraliomargarita sp.]
MIKDITMGIRVTASLLILLGMTGCTSVDFDYPKKKSAAVEPDPLRLLWSDAPEVSDGYSHFHMISEGIDALALRILIAEKAEHTIDVQYYLIKDDIIGYAFIGALIKAADRGVRVRLLLDDNLTKGFEEVFAALDAHPNFELRIFNPFSRRSLRVLDALTDFSRVNRRMHNKTFIVDNEYVIIGGRNIASEYFGANESERFSDLDVLAVGPVVKEASGMFDSYWNHQLSLPVPAFYRHRLDGEAMLQALRQDIDAVLKDQDDRRAYREAAKARYDYFAASDASLFTAAPYQLVFDSPDKGEKELAEEALSIRAPLRAAVESATEELIVVSPYFIPLKDTVEELIAIDQSGVRIVVVTNSLTANNHLFVHSGYAPIRKPLLRGGVEMFEARYDIEVAGSQYVATEKTLTTLHTKAFIVDREKIFVGSFNFDPRSAYINTESGVIIDSPELVRPLVKRFEEIVPEHAYELFLNDRGHLTWRTEIDGELVEYKTDPEASLWQRIFSAMLGLLPIDKQL